MGKRGVRVSRSPRACPRSPEKRKKITPVLQAQSPQVSHDDIQDNTLLLSGVTPQNVIIAAKCNTDAKCNTNAKCNNIDAKCNKVFNAKCNNFLTQNVITFLTHNVITQNVITGVVLRNHYHNPVTFTYTLIE